MTSPINLVKQLLNRYPRIKSMSARMVAAVPLSLRLGKGFWEWSAFFEESEKWSAEELEQYQMEQLRSLLHELVLTSSYYRNLISSEAIDQLGSIRDFSIALPTLSRQQFIENYDDILTLKRRKIGSERSQTSGTTGSALQFYHPIGDGVREWAAICHQWKRVGYLPGISRRAEFRGLTSDGQLVEEIPQRNMIRCSILHLKKEHVRFYADMIEKNAIDFFHGYPSALTLLANEITTSGLKFPQPKAILLASEVVYDWQLEKINQAFPNARIYAHYGCAERTGLAGWCEKRAEYHVLPQYALVEINPDTSEIMGTNLFNTINGFVRFRMTDVAVGVWEEPCHDCGRSYMPGFADIAGRLEDYLYSPEMGWIPPAIVTYPLKNLNAIKEIQFIQHEKARIIIRYSVRDVENKLLVSIELDELRHNLSRLLGQEMCLDAIEVKDFARGETGKFKWIISDVAEQEEGFIS